jgi:hypothetical protein
MKMRKTGNAFLHWKLITIKVKISKQYNVLVANVRLYVFV